MYLVHGHTTMITVTLPRYPKIAQVELLKVSELKIILKNHLSFLPVRNLTKLKV